MSDIQWDDNLAATFEREVEQTRPIGIASRRYALNALSKHMRSEAPVIMDIGCANGYMIRDLQRRFPAASIIGCDHSMRALRRLSESMPSVQLVQLDLSASTWPDECCDAITLLNVLEHIEDDNAALTHARRMLRKDGILVAEVPAGPHLYDSFDKLLGHFQRYTMPDLVRKLERAGFGILDRSHIGFLAYPVFRRLKLKNRKSAKDPQDIMMDMFEQGRRKTSIQNAIFAVEGMLRPIMPMPFGIRCVVTAIKA